MALVVEDGTGLASADSYLSVAGADSYHASHGNPSAWSSASTAAKESALQLATQFLDLTYGGQWLGVRIIETMSLDWPRYGVTDRDGFVIDSDAVPVQIEHATAYLALQVVNGDTLSPVVSAGTNISSESVTVGPITTSKTYIGEKTVAKNYPTVAMMLAPLIGGSSRIYRA